MTFLGVVKFIIIPMWLITMAGEDSLIQAAEERQKAVQVQVIPAPGEPINTIRVE